MKPGKVFDSFRSVSKKNRELLAKAVTIMLETEDWKVIPIIESSIYVKIVQYKTKMKPVTIIRYYNRALEKLLGETFKLTQLKLKYNFTKAMNPMPQKYERHKKCRWE